MLCKQHGIFLFLLSYFHMQHVAIMKKSWRFVEMILSGDKTIESRWYMTRRAPWGMIKKGETIYFRNSGEPVIVKAIVKDIVSFSDLTPLKVKSILEKYGTLIGIDDDQLPSYFKLFRNKKYCILLFLEKVEKTKPFAVDKKGFGNMAAWISVPKIELIRRKVEEGI
jgi:ASC-1-like (ASCH) protein